MKTAVHQGLIKGKLMRYVFLGPDEVANTPDFEFVETFLRDTGRTQIGWHYFID